MSHRMLTSLLAGFFVLFGFGVSTTAFAGTPDSQNSHIAGDDHDKMKDKEEDEKKKKDEDDEDDSDDEMKEDKEKEDEGGDSPY